MTCQLCNGIGHRPVKVLSTEEKQTPKDPFGVLMQYISSPKVKVEICCDCNGTGKLEEISA